jgi:hypothetical protein
MATSGLRISYRPVRFGWCVRNNSWDDLRRAVRLSHTLWGGRFNPVIPVENTEVAEALVRLYRVDVLYPVADERPLQDFLARFPWLPWPNFRRELFIPGGKGTIAAFLDIYHVVRDIFDEQIKDKSDPKFHATLFEWDAADPLQDVFLTYFGGYPPQDEISKDYFDFVEKNLRGSRVKLRAEGQVDPDALNAITPSALTAHLVEWDSSPKWGSPGVYVGEVSDFEDIVNFWNLRATDAELIFYDPEHRNRLEGLKDAFVERVGKRVTDPTTFVSEASMAVWAKEGRDIDPRQFGLKHILCHSVSNTTWNGYNLKPTRFHIGRSRSTLGTASDAGQVLELSVQLPEKPFFDEPEFHEQQVVMTLSSIGLPSEQGESTYRVPFLPVLNEFYGRKMYFHWTSVRVEVDGLGIIGSVTKSHLDLKSVSNRELVIEMFRAFGMKAEVSAPGRIAYRLIQQMGGIQGCRVFKIPGVRDLLEAFGPQDSFDRTNAIQTIGRSDPQTGVPNFSEYENLFIEPRESRPLKPEQAFLFLLKRGVFQVGLAFSCPHCELDPWIHLDNLATETKCEYCGKSFLTTPQLRDRNWKYRRSGLFGRANSQEGSVPVVVTLQQMHTVLSMNNLLFLTNLNIEPDTAHVESCETDLVLVQQHYFEDRVSIAIGECKTRQEITNEDVRKLSLVADALEENGLDSFIIFSKLAPFTPDEIARCQVAQSPHRPRVIMLTDRELEPYSVYERTEKEFLVRSSAISLEDLAESTDVVFFHPRPRPKPGV